LLRTKSKYADEDDDHNPGETCGGQCTWDCFCVCHDGLLSSDPFSAALDGCEEIQRPEICTEPLGDIRGEWATAYLNEYAEMLPLQEYFIEKGGYEQRFSVYCCAEETYVIIDYLLVDLGEDGYDDGWVEVPATLIMSGRFLSFIAELTYRRAAFLWGHDYDRLMETEDLCWWKDVAPPPNWFLSFLEDKVNKMAGSEARVTLQVHCNSLDGDVFTVYDNQTGNIGMLRPSQYFDPRFRFFGWLTTRVNGAGSDAWVIQARDAVRMAYTERRICKWTLEEHYRHCSHALGLWPQDRDYLHRLNGVVDQLTCHLPTVSFMGDSLDGPAFDLWGGEMSLPTEFSGDSVSETNDSVTEDEDEVYVRNCELWSNFITQIVAGLHPLPGSDSGLEDEQGLLSFALKRGKGVEDGVPLQRTSTTKKDIGRLIPKPLVVRVKVNGHPVKALIDSGSTGDFISAGLVDQLKIKRVELEQTIPVSLAVQGSRSKVNFGVIVQLEYDTINSSRWFDVINVAQYDIILGTPWLFQHQIRYSLNPPSVEVLAEKPVEIKGVNIDRLQSKAAKLVDEDFEKLRMDLHAYAEAAGLYVDPSSTPLPPLRAINHEILLIDENKIYPWRPARCAAVFQAQWVAKKAGYLQTGRWRITTSRNTVPLLCIPKPNKPKDKPELRTAVDLRARNANTHKMSAPLPNIEAVIRRVAAHKYRSLFDQKDAYEQIRVIPEHVSRTAVTTPDGNIESLVLQIGDSNAPATYQALMNHIFSPYIGVFLDVYLDDIVVYSDSLEEHINHCKTVFDVLQREKLYLSKHKMQLLPQELKVLGRIIDDEGIRMDPVKVDSVAAWKVPTSKERLQSFLGAVSYLADDISEIRIPMGLLHTLASENMPWRWSMTHQRAFEEVKRRVHSFREHRRKPLRYGADAPPINLITNASSTGVAGVISQGVDWKTADVAAFYSAKMTTTQQHYAVHEQEMLAGLESMMRHKDILLGTHFRWYTDHKGLIHLLKQPKLSARQVRWMEAMSDFSFEVIYVPGVDNILADALSRLYSNDSPGMRRVPSEYTQFDDNSIPELVDPDFTVGVTVGLEAAAMTTRSASGKLPKNDWTHLRRDEKDHWDDPQWVESLSKHPLRAPEGVTEDVDSSKPTVGSNDTDGQSEVNIDQLNSPVEPTSVSAPQGGKNTTPRVDLDDGSALRAVPRREGDVTRQPEAIDQHDQILPPNTYPEDDLLDIVGRKFDGVHFMNVIKNNYLEDPFFAKVLNAPKQFQNFKYRDGLLYLSDRGHEVLCVPENVSFRGRSVREHIISEAHSLLAHLGAAKTVTYLKDHCWWKSMTDDVVKFCSSCETCARSKPNNQKPYGLLNPLEVPTSPWETIGIDFIGPLPESSDRDASYNQITVIIDLLTASVVLVPSRIDYKAKDVAELIYHEVYKNYGLPQNIVSDRDVLFTSHFWQELNKLLGIKLRMSTAYHPQTDGSTERANRTITQMIRTCIAPDQKDWVQKLPGIQFAINSARSESTGFAPFFLNHGRIPKTMIWENPDGSRYPGVVKFAERMKLAIFSAHDSILVARVKQTRDANKHRRQAPFVEGDLVYLSTQNIKLQKGLARKFAPKFIGPYKLLKSYGNNSFLVDLPPELK
jgi:hypothetical protein